jgi:hypothetical protein
LNFCASANDTVSAANCFIFALKGVWVEWSSVAHRVWIWSDEAEKCVRSARKVESKQKQAVDDDENEWQRGNFHDSLSTWENSSSNFLVIASVASGFHQTKARE